MLHLLLPKSVFSFFERYHNSHERFCQ
jgi:hypothetical protein